MTERHSWSEPYRYRSAKGVDHTSRICSFCEIEKLTIHYPGERFPVTQFWRGDVQVISTGTPECTRAPALEVTR